MKKITLLFTLFCSVLVFSQEFTIDNINYSVTSSIEPYTVEVIDSPDATGTIIITDTVTNDGTEYAITSIGIDAFKENELTSVTIPNSVITIEQGAFWGNNLETIIIPDNVTIIPFGAFYQNKLKTVIIPNNVTTIGDGAFRENELTSVTIGNSVTSIEKSAFADNTSLISVSISTVTPPSAPSTTFNNISSNAVLIVPNTAVTDYENTDVWKDFNIISEENTTFIEGDYTYTVTSANTVEVIDYNEANTEISIPGTAINTVNNTNYTVTSIGSTAFERIGLTSVIIPESIITIGTYAFKNNELTSVIIPNNVTTINLDAFRANNLTAITIPDNVTTIGNKAFSLNQLETITIGSGVTTIDSSAFEDNDDLSFVSISASTPPTISDTVFNVPILSDVILSTPNSDYSTTDIWQDFTIISGAFSEGDFIYSTIVNNSVRVVAYTGSGGSVEIPNDLTIDNEEYTVDAIAANTFKNTLITEITLPNNITFIENFAFTENASLTKVISRIDGSISLPNLFDNVFTNRGDIDLVIPEGQGISTLYSFTGWTGFKSVTQDSSLSINDIALFKEINILVTNQDVTVITSNDIVLQNIIIYNISGVAVLKSNTNTVSTTTLTTGIYIAKITTNKGIITKKLKH